MTNLLKRVKGERTRHSITQEALVLFAQHGVDATSMKDVAVKVGVSEAALYRYFSSKSVLVWQIFADGYCGLAETLENAQKERTTARDKLSRLVEIYCNLHDTNQSLFRFLFLTQHGQLTNLTPGMPNPVDVVMRVIKFGISSKEIPNRDPALLTALFFGIVTQPAVFQIYDRISGKMSRHKSLLSDAAWAAISFKKDTKS